MIGIQINDRYLLEAELGRGGMGLVYNGRDPLQKRSERKENPGS